jgi:hypothetical protein
MFSCCVDSHTCSNVSECGNSEGFLQNQILQTYLIQNIFREKTEQIKNFIGIYGESLISRLPGLLPKIFKKDITHFASAFLLFRPFPCQNVYKVQVFSKIRFVSEIFQKQFRKQHCQICFLFVCNVFSEIYLRRVFESDINQKNMIDYIFPGFGPMAAEEGFY